MQNEQNKKSSETHITDIPFEVFLQTPGDRLWLIFLALTCKKFYKHFDSVLKTIKPLDRYRNELKYEVEIFEAARRLYKHQEAVDATISASDIADASLPRVIVSRGSPLYRMLQAHGYTDVFRFMTQMCISRDSLRDMELGELSHSAMYSSCIVSGKLRYLIKSYRGIRTEPCWKKHNSEYRISDMLRCLGVGDLFLKVEDPLHALTLLDYDEFTKLQWYDKSYDVSRAIKIIEVAVMTREGCDPDPMSLNEAIKCRNCNNMGNHNYEHNKDWFG